MEWLDCTDFEKGHYIDERSNKHHDTTHQQEHPSLVWDDEDITPVWSAPRAKIYRPPFVSHKSMMGVYTGANLDVMPLRRNIVREIAPQQPFLSLAMINKYQAILQRLKMILKKRIENGNVSQDESLGVTTKVEDHP